MKKQPIILEGGLNGIPIGFFSNELDRDEAFEKYILPNSENCFKGWRK